MRKIFYAPDSFRDTIECPDCGSPDTDFMEVIKKPCNCIYKKEDTWIIYFCNKCKLDYGVKQ